ncbi:hypothetical protein PENSPDRAFT_748886 [Peniophora sp. CONT]|nr:hypothetical protein PENSPDRAFT_748886 [Peniophora sp. CONT]
MAERVTVYSLPPELLLETFHHLSQLEPLDVVDYIEDQDVSDTTSLASSVASNSSTTSLDDDYITESDSESSTYSIYPWIPSFGWTRVTRVCSLWRRVALDSAALWCTIPLDFCSEWVDELLRRSKEAPLDLVIRSSESGEHVISLIFQLDVWHRVRRIICHNHLVPVLELIGSGMGYGMPALEDLDLSGISYPALKLNDFQNLRRLEVELAGDDPTLSTFSERIHLPSLMELKLRMLRNQAHSIPVTVQWSILLQNLTILALCEVHFDFQDDIIELPRLRELRIVEVGVHCGSFVQHIRTPFLETYRVQHFRPSEYSETTDLVMVKAMGFSRALDDVADATVPALHTLVVTHLVSSYFNNVSNNIAVHGWRFARQNVIMEDFPIDDTRMAPIEADMSHIVELTTLPADPGRIQLQNFALVLLSHPALSSLRLLSLELHPELALGDVISWVDLLQPMHHLQHLRISPPENNGSGTPISILRALQRQQVDGAFVVASMQRLTLVDWDPNMTENDSDMAVPGEVLRDIALSRLHETSLEAIHIVSWRRYYDNKWQRHLSGEGGVKIIYKHQFLSLDHVHAIDDSDSASDTDDEAVEAGLQA